MQYQLSIYIHFSITFAREGYKFFDTDLFDLYEFATNMAFWQFAFKNFSLSMGELYRDLNKSAFLRSGQKFIPCLRDDMVEPSFSGIMSQVFEVGIH